MPLTPLTGKTVNVEPLQTSANIADITGVGSTVTTIFEGTPGHVLAEGVTMYVTDPVVAFGLLSTWAMVEPLEALAPVILPVIIPIVQLNVLPTKLLVNAMFVVAPLQITVELAVLTFGVGLTVTTMFVGLPVQVFAVGVTI